MLQGAEVVALSELWRIDIAVKCQQLTTALIKGCIADEWATHIVVFHLPKTAQLHPIGAIYA